MQASHNQNKKKEKKGGMWSISRFWCYVFPTLVAEGSVAGNLGIAVWARLQSETFGPDVLMHQFGEFRVAEQGPLWLTREQ
jgi:hypothetical protein